MNEIRCAKCGMAPPSIPEESVAEFKCVKCGTVNTVRLYPAAWRLTEIAEAAPVLPEEASCFLHPEAKAVAVCSSCGRFLCGMCEIVIKGKTVCPQCMAKPSGEKDRVPRLMRYDKLALMLAVVSFFITLFGIFTILASLFVCIRWWKAPLGPTCDSRWRFRLALALCILVAVVATLLILQ